MLALKPSNFPKAMISILMTLELTSVFLSAGEIDQMSSVGAVDSKLRPAQTTYDCFKIDQKITLDGSLDENAWKHAPTMQFVGITDGLKAPYISEAKMLWDDNYLYIT